MKTEVFMKRELFGSEVRQSNQTEFISANDIVRAGDRWRLANNMQFFNFQGWLNTQGTKDFIKALEKEFGKVIIAKRGQHGGTWVHPYLAIDLALAISPTLKIEVYKWLHDELLKYRNFSGNSYKKMAGALWARTTNKRNFQPLMVDIANKIKLACQVQDWESATEDQLRLRDKIHNNIALLAEVMNNNDEAIRLGILNAIKHLDILG